MSNEIADTQPYSDRIVIHSSVIEEVSKYPNALDSIREYVANSWDADADRLEITLGDNYLRIEDWGTGVSNFKLFWGVADQHKSGIVLTPKYKRKPIGRKGLGKLSYMMLGNKISVETRTPHKAEYSDADFSNMKFDVLPRKKIDEVLNHKGTQITIRDLKVEIKKDELIKYLKDNLYGLILPIACPEHPMKIFVNNEKVCPTKIDGNSGTMVTSFGDIYCNLKPSKTSRIDALFRGVKVKEVNPAPTHPARGYFNVDWTIPTPDRSNFTDSEEARLFYAEIKKYVLRNIPSKNEDSPKDMEKSMKDISKIFEDILRDKQILPENQMPSSRTSSPTDLKAGGVAEQENKQTKSEEKESQETQQERRKLQNKILKGKEKPLRTAFGINFFMSKVGRDKPAVVTFKEEKTVIFNMDHDLLKNLHGLRPLQKNMIMCTLFARGHFHVLEAFRDIRGYEEYVDDMVSVAISKISRE
jgi:hypothetical protein